MEGVTAGMRNEGWKDQSIRTVEPAGSNSRKCFLIFQGKEAFYYKPACSWNVLPPSHVKKTSSVVHSKLIWKCAKCAQGWAQSSASLRKLIHCTIKDPDPCRTVLGQIMIAFHRRDRGLHAHSVGASNWSVSAALLQVAVRLQDPPAVKFGW